MKRTILLLTSAALALLMLAGCSDNTGNDNTGGSGTAKESSGANAADGYQDGDYTAEFKDFDENGWKTTASVTVENGKIKSCVIDAIDEDGNKKSEDAAYKERWLAAAPEDDMYPEKAFSAIQNAYVKQQNTDFDNIEHATGATNDAKTILKALEDRMKRGDTAKLIVDNPKTDE